jgi:hypothetical protein
MRKEIYLSLIVVIFTFFGCNNTETPEIIIQNDNSVEIPIPRPPEDIRVTKRSNLTPLYVYCTDVPEATSYDLYLGTSAQNLTYNRTYLFPYTITSSSSTTLTTSIEMFINGDELTSGVTYFVGVKSRNKSGTSEMSKIVSKTY